jgi:hypothetical protein
MEVKTVPGDGSTAGHTELQQRTPTVTQLRS